MSIRFACFAAALAATIALPAAANEAGFIAPVPQLGSGVGKSVTAAPATGRAVQPGDVTADGRYVYLGSEVGWSIAPHEMLWQAGSLVHSERCVHAALKPGLHRSPQEIEFHKETQVGG